MHVALLGPRHQREEVTCQLRPECRKQQPWGEGWRALHAEGRAGRQARGWHDPSKSKEQQEGPHGWRTEAEQGAQAALPIGRSVDGRSAGGRQRV